MKIGPRYGQGESKAAEDRLGQVVMDLAITSKEADNILKKVKANEIKNLNNEVTMEEMDKAVREAIRSAGI